MARTKQQHFITFGPAIPVVPVKQFTKFSTVGIDKEMFQRAWEIIGPSVEHNMRRQSEMWQIITAAYLEGLSHGAAIERERNVNGDR